MFILGKLRSFKNKKRGIKKKNLSTEEKKCPISWRTGQVKEGGWQNYMVEEKGGESGLPNLKYGPQTNT